MRRLAVWLAVLALLAAACSGEPTAGNGGGPPSDETQDGGNGGGKGDGGTNGGNGDDPSVPGNSPPPQVEPSLPGEGESTAIEFEVLASGTDPDEEDPSSPYMRLIRNAEAGEQVAARAPVPGAADAIRSWEDYGSRALLAIFGGAQPDSGYAMQVNAVSVTEGGEVITAFTLLRAREGPASQVISVPWAVISVPAGAAVLAVRCVLAPDSQSAIEARC